MRSWSIPHHQPLRRFLGALTILVLTSGSASTLTRRDLQDAGFHLVSGTPLPDIVLHGIDKDMPLRAALAGKPALLIFTDYRCRSLCGLVLDQLAQVLPHVGLTLGHDYNVISVALDSNETRADVIAFRDQHTQGSVFGERALFFTNDKSALDALRARTGLIAPFDPEHAQFAHPAGLVLVDAKGRVQRVISPFAINPLDLKLALLDSGAAPRSISAHALMLCYGWDAATGVYTIQVERILMVGASLTVLLMIGWLTILLHRERTNI